MIEVAINCDLINGQKAKDLKTEPSEYVGVKHCITCANGVDRGVEKVVSVIH